MSGSGISWAICKSAPRSRQITTPAPHYSSFFTGRMPFLPPNQQCQSTEGNSWSINNNNKIDKYSKLASTHIFYPFAIETAGTWHEMAIELTQEIGRRITTVTEDTPKTTFLFQCLSMALQRGNAFLSTTPW